MKTKKTMIIVCGIILIVIAGFGIFFSILSVTNNPLFLRSKILTKCNSFKGIWDMGSPQINENEKRIKIGFRLMVNKNVSRFDEENYELTATTCEEISDYLFSDRFHFKEEGYQIEYCFSDNQLFHLEVQNVGPGMQNIYLDLSDDYYFPKSKFGEWYPRTEALNVSSIDDDVIELIKYLPQLKHIRTGPDLTDDQREKILEICPDVEIDARIYRQRRN